MALHLYPVVWQKSMSLDRGRANQFSEREDIPELEDLRANPSFLYSARLRQSLQESRKAFLNLSLCPNDSETDKEDDRQEPKRPAVRKISYKCKRASSLHRKTNGRIATSALRGNSVAELASKFDKLVEKKSILEDPKFARLVRRVNSQRSSQDGARVARKPSVKMKHSFKSDEKTLYISRRSSLVRKISVKKIPKTTGGSQGDKMCVRAKITYLESPQSVVKCESDAALNSTVRRLPIVPKKPPKTPNNVRATIDLFEKRTNTNDQTISKPKVPEKKIDPKTIDLITKHRKLLDQTKQKPACTKPNEQDELKTTDEKTDFDVQILNIPIIPKKCESSYETSRFSIKSKPDDRNDKSSEMKPNCSFLWRRNSEKSSIYDVMSFDSEDNQEKGLKEGECDAQAVDDNSNSQDDRCKYSSNPSICVQGTIDEENVYDFVDPTLQSAQSAPSVNLDTLPKKALKKKMPEPEIYEELADRKEIDNSHSYEICNPVPTYEDLEQNDGYEAVNPVSADSKENLYEVLPAKKTPPPLLPKRQEEPLPPRPPSKNPYYLTRNNTEVISNCYESIYNTTTVDTVCDNESNYESIYGCQLTANWGGSGSNRDSLVSSDQQSNSLYGRSIPSWTEDVLNYKTGSVSSSERSDDWVDMSDNEQDSINPGFILVREKTKISKKTSGWSQQLREQRAKSPRKHTVSQGDSDSDHHYESLHNGQNESHGDSDSFDSDSECSYDKVNMHDSGVDMEQTQLPEPPNNQPYVLTRLAASAGKHMKRLRRNWSLTKNDISKSLSRMTKRKSRTDLDIIEKPKEENTPPPLPEKNFKSRLSAPSLNSSTNDVSQEMRARNSQSSLNSQTYQNVHYNRNSVGGDSVGENIYEKSKNKKGFLKKFRRSMSLSAESASDLTQDLNKPKSTFYLTEDIDIDDNQTNEVETRKHSLSPTTIKAKSKSSPVRPQVPPPPLPMVTAPLNSNTDTHNVTKIENKRSTSWYAECGLFKNSENGTINLSKRPNTFWYAEVGLYQTGPSTPSTSSAENSGNGAVTIKNQINAADNESSEEYYNIETEENDYYNDSIGSSSSHETKMDKSYSTLSGDMQLLLQDEPLYQFYDAALSDTVCKEGTTDLDYDDGYEEVGGHLILQNQPRPSAMELISPNKNSVSVTRTFWCEIPEVQQSTVLSTLSLHHKKIQESKFEMMTSEASYLNSLNVLTNHFIKNLSNNEWLTPEDKEILFGKIPAVKNCSEKLLQDLEKCWQDSIFLNDICKVIHRHSEENFYVYVSFCENQILLDRTLRKLKTRGNFHETLKQLEASPACHALTLYSFLMLPMQRITRWPLLLDAYVKRLSPQDTDYLYCQYAVATINKILNQCNEAARRKERETEMKEIASQLDFGKIPPIELVSGSRWVVKAAPVTQLLMRGDDVKLTFGKRFSKVPLFLFLFNDLFLVTKYRSTEDNYLVLHYCARNMIDINVEALQNITIKDAQGKHLLFLTILENQDDKLVEFLLSCNADSEKERWISAITPPKSEDPNETLYECWDCPQVTAIHNYSADQPDELPLSRGDIINVTRKMADGWYHGERLRDGLTGWFPSNYVEDVANQHVRARNLKQRYRLLAFSENYLKSK